MPDKISPAIRSRIMSMIRSQWTKPEKKIHNFLKGNRIRHVMHPDLLGNPDAFIIDYNAVLFIDGCFWHNCPYHGHIPKSNKEYWLPKIEKNISRDKKYTAELEEQGFKVIRIWECDIMNEGSTLKNFKTNFLFREE